MAAGGWFPFSLYATHTYTIIKEKKKKKPFYFYAF